MLFNFGASIFTLCLLAISPVAALPQSQSSGRGVSTNVTPPDWPLNSFWPQTITCKDVKLDLTSYESEVKNAKYIGRVLKVLDGKVDHVPTWQLLRSVTFGTQVYRIVITFRAEAGNLIYEPKSTFHVDDQNDRTVIAVQVCEFEISESPD